MFSNKKNLRAFIVLAAIFLLLIVNGLFTLGSVNNNPSTAWRTRVRGGGDAYFTVHLADQDAAGNDRTYDKDDSNRYYVNVWLNVGRIFYSTESSDAASVTISWKTSSGSSYSNGSTFSVQKGVDVANGGGQYVWVRQRVGFTSQSYTDFKIATKSDMEINEVVFTKDDGTLFVPELMKYTEPDTTAYSGTTLSEKDFDAEKPATEPAHLVDEQSKFEMYSKMGKKYNFTSAEAGIVNSIFTIENGDGFYLDSRTGAFGIELIAIGVYAFGVNPVGVRIVPYIFFLLTVGLVFAFGRRIFKDSDAGLVFAAFYVLLGLGLSAGSVGSAVTIAAFFAMLSVLFMYGFYEKAADYVFTKKSHRFTAGTMTILAPVLLSALMFSLAFNCSVYTIFLLPAVIAAFVAGLIRVRRVYAFNDKQAEFEDEKVRNRKQYNINMYGSVITAVVSFVVLWLVFSLLFHLFVNDAYINVYRQQTGKEELSLMGAIFASIRSAFAQTGPKGEFIKWIGGVGATLIYSGAQSSANFTDVYISMNIAVQFIALLSFICMTFMFVRYACLAKKGGENKKEFRKFAVPYSILACGAIFGWVLYGFIGGSTVVDFVPASLFFTAFIPFAFVTYLHGTDGTVRIAGREVKEAVVALIIALAVSVIFFGLGYVMFTGIEVRKLAARILYRWWLI